MPRTKRKSEGQRRQQIRVAVAISRREARADTLKAKRKACINTDGTPIASEDESKRISVNQTLSAATHKTEETTNDSMKVPQKTVEIPADSQFKSKRICLMHTPQIAKKRKGTHCSRQEKIVAFNMSEYWRTYHELQNKKDTAELKQSVCKVNTLRKQKTREDLSYRDKEKRKDRDARQKARANPTYREREKVREIACKQKARKDSSYREREKMREKADKEEARKDSSYREGEKVRDKAGREKARKDTSYRAREKVRDKAGREKARKDSLYREKEKMNDRDARQKARADPNKRKREQSLESPRKRARRQDATYRDHENEERNQSRKNRTATLTLADYIKRFHNTVAEGPVHVCCCCEQLFYKHTVTTVNSIQFPNSKALDLCLNESKEGYICHTCARYLKIKKMPPMAVANDLTFPTIPENLMDTTPMEWRLCSPRIVFKKVHEAPRGRQWKIRGNLVNVPTDVSKTYTSLPHLANDHQTVKVKLKRQLKYKHHVWSENVRPERVRQVAQFLSNQPLFKEQGITYDPEWQPPSATG